MLEPGKQAKLDIEISTPDRSRYRKLAGRQINIQYEVRYNFLTHAIGSEIIFRVQLSDDWESNLTERKDLELKLPLELDF